MAPRLPGPLERFRVNARADIQKLCRPFSQEQALQSLTHSCDLWSTLLQPLLHPLVSARNSLLFILSLTLLSQIKSDYFGNRFLQTFELWHFQDIPGLTSSKISPDGKIAQVDVGSKLVIVSPQRTRVLTLIGNGWGPCSGKKLHNKKVSASPKILLIIGLRDTWIGNKSLVPKVDSQATAQDSDIQCGEPSPISTN